MEWSRRVLATVLPRQQGMLTQRDNSSITRGIIDCELYYYLWIDEMMTVTTGDCDSHRPRNPMLFITVL